MVTLILKNMEKYAPISCDFYDWIEHYATKKEWVTIKYKDAQGEEQTVQRLILTTLTQVDGEYLLLNADLPPIRLDRLISIEDQMLANFQAC
jgi:Rho-binding antiterminator